MTCTPNALQLMLEALKTTQGNIQSLGPSGALGDVWPPYRTWLRIVSEAIEVGERELDPS